MTSIITHLLAFVGGVWFALENPYFGRTIKEYAELGVAYASQFFGG
jgi:hypothetical protein